jgi:putative FmdB family regulatory protein
MPIYEYYCRPCHTIYSFLARGTKSTSLPACPKCGARQLSKQVSRFAISKGRKENSEAAGSDPFENVDDAQMEKLMAEMSGAFGDDGDGVPENPHEMARMMNRMFQVTGMQPGEAMQEAIRRMEAGEDPDRIDEEMGGLLDAEEPMFGNAQGIKGRLRRYVDPPNVDPELYDY